jgi:hypothetical protein
LPQLLRQHFWEIPGISFFKIRVALHFSVEQMKKNNCSSDLPAAVIPAPRRLADSGYITYS